MDDPRVFFAAERTTLAWVRTGIAAMGLGFVVARFGMFMAYLAHPGQEPEKTGSSLAIGVALVICGSLACILASVQFWWFTKHMRPEELPPRYFLHFATAGSTALGVAGALLAVHLMW
jgi:putative membrane protein